MKGRPLSADFRASIIDEILRNGDNIYTGYFPGRFENVARQFKVSRSCAENVGRRLCRECTRDLKHQTFLVPRTPTGSIFAA